MMVAPPTEAPHTAFPPFDVSTYPSQLFWLTVTFVVLLVIMWKVVVPRLSAVIEARKSCIDGDIAAAAKHKQEAEAALTGYETALADAKSHAAKLAEENRKAIEAAADKAKAEADTEAKAQADAAEGRIAAMRTQAAEKVAEAAETATTDIVSRLIGETVSTDEAAKAVKAVLA